MKNNALRRFISDVPPTQEFELDLINIMKEGRVKIELRSYESGRLHHVYLCSKERFSFVLRVLVRRLLTHRICAKGFTISPSLWCPKIEDLLTNPSSPILDLSVSEDENITSTLDPRLEHVMKTRGCRLRHVSCTESSAWTKRAFREFKKMQRRILPVQNQVLTLLCVHSRAQIQRLPVDLLRMLSSFLI